MDDSCFCAYALLYWVESGSGISIDNNVLKTCVFTKPDQEELVIVIINDSDAAVDTGLSLAGIPNLSALSMYETSDEHNLQRVYSSSSIEQLSFKPRSVTTFVLTPDD